MIRFDSDYCEGAHPDVLDLLVKTNLEQTEPYGEDAYCRRAAELIRQKCGNDRLDVHFLVGGTQTNLTLISAALRPFQGVIAADTGHISIHETGAIEATGHKVLMLAACDGKLRADRIREAYENHVNDCNHEHMVQPKLVYLSNPTETGTIYSKKELTEISETCRACGMYLYLDGARLAYALEASGNDLDLPALSRLCDAFYIGGTKVGALFGEALVIADPHLQEDFRYCMKQKGALLAKGRLLGLQFIALFEKNLYFEIGAHADRLAEQIKDALIRKGYGFLSMTPTNQQFPIIPDCDLEIIGQKYVYSYWQRIDKDHSAVRFCTGWATREEDVEELVLDIENL